MLVDVEAVLLDLKRHIGAKSHHGQRELFAVIAEAEVRNQIEEGLPDKALRLYGLEFFEEVIRPRSSEERVLRSEGYQVRASRGDSKPESEEDDHGSRNGTGPPGALSGVPAARESGNVAPFRRGGRQARP